MANKPNSDTVGAASAVPRYSKEFIERRAHQALASYCPKAVDTGGATPLGEFCLCVQRDLNARFIFNRQLGKTTRGHQILGACYFEPIYQICVDPSLSGDAQRLRFRFTLAHELGHLSLHRKLRLQFQSLDATARAILDGANDFVPGRRGLVTSRDFLEWQANSYAAALLMPRATFVNELRKQQTEMGISRVGVVWLSNSPGSDCDYTEIVNRLSFVYQTSVTATRIRMQELGLLRGYRSPEARTPQGTDSALTLNDAMSEALKGLLRRFESPSDEN